MSLVVAFDDIKPEQVKHRREPGKIGSTTFPFFRATSDTPNSPSAYIRRYDPGLFSSAHFHKNDQFQIVVDGKAQFGRHDVSPYCVHFSRAYTRYGPLQADKETGWAFLVLRSHYDAGAYYTKDELMQVTNRRPWQITKKITFPARGTGVNVQEIPEIKDDQGLFVRALSMGPHTWMTAPDPSTGDGQFLVVFKGSLVHENSERKAMTVVFLKPEEPAFRIQAGAQGLEGVIFNLPQVKSRAAAENTPSITVGFKKWQCLLCSFAYDEAIGIPEEGIPAGTRWEDVPNSWSCPDCSASKSDFQMVEV